MRVDWTKNALDHLSQIYEFISRDSQAYAMRMVDRITARSVQIGNLPHSGQVVVEYDDPQIREIIEGPYRIIYRVEKHRVAVLAVLHGARLLPPDLPQSTT